MRVLVLATALAACDSSPGAGFDAGGDAAVADAVPADARACGVRGDRRGKTTRTIQAGGLMRTYHAYLPATVDAKTPVPLVFVHHGYTMSGQLMYDVTRYAQLADTEHIAVAFPDGQGGALTLGAPWNVGSGVCPSFAGTPPNASGDDFALLDAITADLTADQCLDEDHVFVTGFSMGGYFSHHAGCMRDDVRAIAPHSGGTHDLAGCTGGIKPVIMFHGTADPVIPVGCADPDALGVIGGEPAAAMWAAHNGCGTATHTRSVQGGTCTRYEACPANGQVELCTFDLMGHCWAGGPASSGIYACPTYADATQLAWQFFKTYAW